jgi:hypothetical protein
VRTVYLSLLLVMSSVVAQAQQVRRVDISEVGIYDAEIVSSNAAPGTPGGSVDKASSNIKLVRATTTIPAILGTRFGFRYKVIGQPDGAFVSVKFVTHYPSLGLRNPSTGNITILGEYSSQVKLGAGAIKGYTLGHDWELVLGTWTFEIWEGEHKLAEQSFTVVKP